MAQTAVLFTAVVVAVLSSEAADWHPIALVLVLSALAVASDVMIVEVRGLRVSGAFFSVVLAMVLLGPAPAVAIGLGTTLAYAAISRRPFQNVLTDSAVWAVFAAVGGLMSEALARDGDTAIRFCAVVVLVYMTTNILNFLLIAAYHRATAGFRLLSSGKRSI